MLLHCETATRFMAARGQKQTSRTSRSYVRLVLKGDLSRWSSVRE